MSYTEFIGVFVVIFSGFYKYYYALLSEEESKKELILKLNKYKYLEFYQIRLKKTLLSLDNSLGEISWNIKFLTSNFMFHYGLSIVYVFFIYYFLWLINGKETLNTINIFESNTNIQDRILVVLGLIIAFIIVYLYEKRKKNVTALDLYGKLFSLVGGTIGMGFVLFSENNQTHTSFTIAIMLVFVLALGFSYQKTFIERMTTIGSFGSLSIISFVVLGLFNYFNNDIFFNKLTISLYFFLLMLPILNAQLDFVSLSISRYFSNKIANDNNVLLILVHLLLDMFFAVILLLVLVNFLYNSIEFINGFLDMNVHIPIKEILIGTMHNPLSLDYMWITSMLLSTLLPTLVHVLLAIITFILYVTKVSSWYILKIKNIGDSRESEKIKTTTFLAFPSTFLALMFTYLLLYLPYIYIIKWMAL